MSVLGGVAVFALVGLLGGIHCLGMCGPFVTVYADRLDSDGPVGWYELRQHGLFNLGRTVSYALIGATFGLLGAMLYDASGVLGVARSVRGIAGVGAGILVMGVGIGYLLNRRNPFTWVEGLGSGVFERIGDPAFDRLDQWVGNLRIFLLGSIHGVLPCPLLYPAYLVALASGDPLLGALWLGSLGLGTFPTLFIYGTALQGLTLSHRERLHRVLGAAFLVAGYLPLSMGLGHFGIDLPRIPVPFYELPPIQ